MSLPPFMPPPTKEEKESRRKFEATQKKHCQKHPPSQELLRKCGRFVAKSNGLTGSPAVYIQGPIFMGYYSKQEDTVYYNLSDQCFKDCFTWIGAYWAAFWRNLLGRLYIPLSPDRRWELEYARQGLVI